MASPKWGTARIADSPQSRTYDDEDQGKIVREGFEPGQLDNASDENVTKVDDERSQGNGKANSSTEYGNLDDQHIWDSNNGA